MAEHTTDSGAGHHAHHVTPISKLAMTYFWLVALMVLTVAAARAPLDMPAQFGWVVPFFWLTNAVALGIAVAKAVQVVQIFMGVKFTTKVVKLFAYGGFVWFLTLFIMFIDYATREWEPVRGWEAGVPSTGLPRERTSDGGVPYTVFEGSHGGSAAASGEHGQGTGH
jgi:caa(3)-type oxidase subunit IV